MSKTNCINCGAAKDTSEIKCPFCGTTYLDLTSIDFSSNDPVVCQFVLPDSFHRGVSGKMVMSMVAVPRLESIEQKVDTVDAFNGYGAKLVSAVNNCDINMGVSFLPVARGVNGTLFTLEVKE